MVQEYVAKNGRDSANASESEISEEDLGTAFGGQAQVPDPVGKAKEAGEALVDTYLPFVKPVLKGAEFGIELGKWVRYQAEHVPSLNMSEKEIESYQARLREAAEHKEDEAAEEQERLINADKEASQQEVEDYLSSTGGGSGGSAPVNEQPYVGEYPSFPTSVTDGPPPYDPQIILEPIGPSAPPPGTEVGRLY